MTSSTAVVLVVEDDPLLRLSAVEEVEAAGFEVLGADSSAAAMVVLEGRLDVRIVFTDIDLPGGMGGLELAAVIRRRWPPIAIIVTSGHVRPDEGELPAGSVFFPKPYGMPEVIAEMQRMAA